MSLSDSIRRPVRCAKQGSERGVRRAGCHSRWACSDRAESDRPCRHRHRLSVLLPAIRRGRVSLSPFSHCCKKHSEHAYLVRFWAVGTDSKPLISTLSLILVKAMSACGRRLLLLPSVCPSLPPILYFGSSNPARYRYSRYSKAYVRGYIPFSHSVLGILDRHGSPAQSRPAVLLHLSRSASAPAHARCRSESSTPRWSPPRSHSPYLRRRSLSVDPHFAQDGIHRLAATHPRADVPSHAGTKASRRTVCQDLRHDRNRRRGLERCVRSAE